MLELSRIKNEYSDYDLRRVRYFYTCLLYEVSKFIIIGGFFCLFGLLPEYFFSVLFICPLRILSGGLHFRSYLGCLLFSILYFSVSIMPFWNYHPTKGTALFLLLLFAIINIVMGPITSDQRPEPSVDIKTVKKQRLLILFIMYFIFFFLSKYSRFFFLANRLLLLHSIQMMVSFIRKEVAR